MDTLQQTNMDIKYLTILTDYPTMTSSTGYVKRLEPISLDEIVRLESAYNNGNMFPTALRELLYLAGSYCYVLDFGIYDTQFDMQVAVRSWLTDHNKAISRPFFAIDVYNAYDQFLFIYLDEGVDDPMVFQAVLYNKSNDETQFSYSLNTQLSKYIEGGISMLLSGYNPF